MKRLSEYKGEEALEVLADLIDPAVEIISDPEVSKHLQNIGGNNRIGALAMAVKSMLKSHKKAVIQLIAALDRKDADTYEVNLFTLPMTLLSILNDPGIVDLFTFAGQTEGVTSSGSASENTEE